MSDLKKFSDAVEQISTIREQERKQFTERLGEPALFFPAEPHAGMAEGHGTGWFLINGHMVAYWRYSNGYSDVPMVVLDVALVKQLYEIVRLSETL